MNSSLTDSTSSSRSEHGQRTFCTRSKNHSSSNGTVSYMKPDTDYCGWMTCPFQFHGTVSYTKSDTDYCGWTAERSTPVPRHNLLHEARHRLIWLDDKYLYTHSQVHSSSTAQSLT